jgi:acetyl-CoA carboxylase carboxyl transferase subunit beta
MNWITKFIKPRLKTLFRKQPKKNEESLWTTCSCQELIYKDDLLKNLHVCPKCETHHKISCRERFNIFFDEGLYNVLETPQPPDDPLNFVDNKKYTDRLKLARKVTKQEDAIMISHGKVNDISVTCGAQNFSFIGGSFSAACGEAFLHGVQHAIENRNPFVFFSCSGGQRLMEGAIALAQMSRTVLAINELKKNNIPYIVVLTNPTTGGVSASFSMLGDFIIAEPKATVGFAGARVIQQTIGQSLPINFQTSEYVLEHGGIDLVVPRNNLRDTIGTLLSILLKKKELESSIKNVNTNTIDEPLRKTSKAV